jgi:hypothetical protein
LKRCRVVSPGCMVLLPHTFWMDFSKVKARKSIWAVPWQNQHSAFATSIDPDQPTHSRSLIRIHAIRLQSLLQVEKLIANSMDPDQSARRRRLVWIHAGRERTMLVLSFYDSSSDILIVLSFIRLGWIDYISKLYNDDWATVEIEKCLGKKLP